MTRHAIPIRLNLIIASTLIAANAFLFVGAPLLLAVSPLWGWALAVPALLTPTLWSLIHEAIHGELHPDRGWNDRIGRALAVAFGSPFQVLRLGHLMHHRHNRSEINRIEVVQGPPGLLDRAAYYARLTGGLYVGEVLAAPIAILPRTLGRPLIWLAFGHEGSDGRTMWEGAQRQLLQEPGRSRMRLDGAIITAMLVLSVWLYGDHWWMPALALAARAFLVSFLDNAYHFANPLDQVMAGYDLRAPRIVQALLLNFNYHATHHQRPNAPWTALPQVFDGLGRRFEGDLLPAALRQFAGPLPEAAYAGGAPAGPVAQKSEMTPSFSQSP